MVGDDELAAAQRHVADGELRIVRQRALVDALKAAGHAKLATDAEALLASFLDLQSQYEAAARRLSEARERQH